MTNDSNTIMIKELPLKTYDTLADTDLMLIEDATDTYHISLDQLRLYFAADEKINEAVTEINSTIDAFKDEVNTKVQGAIDSNISIDTRVTNLYQDHENTKKQVGKLVEDLSATRTSVNEITTHLSNHDTQIEDLVTKTTDHENRLSKVEEMVQPSAFDQMLADISKNKEDIATLQTDLAALDTKADNINNRFGDLGVDENNNPKTVQEYAEALYDELMKYIDYYHHVSTNPPNFDEPYAGDPQVSNFVYPVGTIFETTVAPAEDGTSEPISKLVGTWKYLGVSTSITAEGEIVANRYTWERIE